MWMKLHAGLIHLGISALVIVGVLALVVAVWYPGAYFGAMGPGSVLGLLVLVDLCMGPLITTIIYDPAKKSLKADLAVVAALQLAAFLYGVSVVFAGRPAYLVFNVDRFTMVAASEISEAEQRAAALRTLPMTGPQLVGVKTPDDKAERERVLFSAVQGGADLPQMPRHYLPYDRVRAEVKSRMLPLTALTEHKQRHEQRAAQALVDACLQKNGLKLEEVGFVPVQARRQDMVAVVARNDAALIDMLPIDPWQR